MSRSIAAGQKVEIKSRRSGSFLVRLWTEESAVGSDQCELRALVRNLQTGRESYLKNVDSISGALLEELATEPSASESQEAVGGRSA